MGTDRRTTLEQILVEYGGGEARRVTLAQILVEWVEPGEKRVTLAQILVEWVDVATQAVSQFGVYVEYRVPDEETGTQIRGWDQIQPGSVMPDRFSPDVAGDGLAGGGEDGALRVNPQDPIFWPPTAQGQAVVSDAAVPPVWVASLTPTWLGEHTFSAGLAVAPAQAITMGDEAYIGCGPADVRIVFDSGNDIALLGGNVGVGALAAQALLTVSGSDLVFPVLIESTTATTAVYPGLEIDAFLNSEIGHGAVLFHTANGTKAVPATMGTDVPVGIIVFRAHDGVDFRDIARIRADTGPAFGVGNREGSIQFLIGDAVAYTEAMRITHLRYVGIGTSDPNRLFHAEVADVVTNSVAYTQRLTHITTNTAIAGFGTGIEFELEENDASNKVAAIIEAKWSDAGEGANADGYFDFLTMLDDGAAASRMVVGYNGLVGVGIATPAYMLDVYHATNDFVANFKSNDDLGGVIIADNDATTYALAKDGYMSLGGQNTLHVGNLNIATATGYVGLNTVAPQRRLDLSDAAGGMTFGDLVVTNNERGIYWHSGAGAAGYAIFRPAGGWTPSSYVPLNIVWQTGIKIDPGAAASPGSYVYIPQGGLTIGTAAQPAVAGALIQGRVGVGTTVAISELHIEAPSDPQLTMVHSGVNTAGLLVDANGLVVANENNDIRFRTSITWNGDWAATGAERMRITNAGLVGIGTVAPFGPLHITDAPGSGMFVTADDVDNVGTTIVPNGAGDVTVILTVYYAVSESVGGTSGGSATVLNNSSVDLYDDGADILTLAVAADGSVTLQRTAGAATFDVSMWMVWL